MVLLEPDFQMHGLSKRIDKVHKVINKEACYLKTSVISISEVRNALELLLKDNMTILMDLVDPTLQLCYSRLLRLREGLSLVLKHIFSIETKEE